MFENLNEVRRANTTGPKGTRKAQFALRVSEAKSTIIFSGEQFAAMNIADNSLSQFVDDVKGIVFLAVMPGNSGTFAKTNARGTKGKKFKNEAFVANLVKHDYVMADIDLYKVGEEDGKTLYQVVGNGKAIMEGAAGGTDAETASDPVADATPAHVSEEEKSFEARAGEPIAEIQQDTDVAQDESIEDALTSPAEEELEF